MSKLSRLTSLDAIDPAPAPGRMSKLSRLTSLDAIDPAPAPGRMSKLSRLTSLDAIDPAPAPVGRVPLTDYMPALARRLIDWQTTPRIEYPLTDSDPLGLGPQLESSIVNLGETVVDRLARQFTALPPEGTEAADLTERDRLALAIAAGAPTETVMEDGRLIVRTLVPVGFADSDDGRLVVAVGQV